jgi:LPXTG-motif cell wall-anchored protein
MRHNNRGLGIVGAMAMSGLMAGIVGAQTIDVKKVEIVSVDGNRVVVRGEQGTEQITVTDDFRMTVDGRPIAIGDLRPGMRGTARTTTTTTAAPGQQTTDVNHGEIVKRSGTSVVAKTAAGTKTYTDEDLAARNVPVTVDGKPVKMSALWEGTKLIETTVTATPERVMTQRQVDLTLQTPQVARATPPTPAAPPRAEPPRAEPPRAEPSPAEPPAVAVNPAPETQAAVRQLPRTASPLSTIGLLGLVCSAAGLLLTMRRRRRTGDQIGRA